MLSDIIAETGGQLRRAMQTDASWIKNADSVSMWWSAGGYISVKFSQETLDHCIKSGQEAAELKKKFVPPVVDDYGDPGWFQIIEFGHTGYNEFLTEFDAVTNPEDAKMIDQCYVSAIKQDVEGGFYNSWQTSLGPLGLMGPAYDNHHVLLSKLKKLFDPNNVSNPPRPFDFDENIEKHAPWVEAHWVKRER